MGGPPRVSILDRYLLGLVLRPLGIGVGVLLVALLLGRVLRLVNLLSVDGAAEFGLVAVLTASLVPHYLGLALAAAFVAAVFVAMIRLGDASELDALLSSGLSLRRIALPFLAVGLALALASFALYGWLNPIARYDYRSVLHSAGAVAYRSDIRPGTFIDAGQGTTVSVDAVDPAGRGVRGIFIHQAEGGRERITTANAGELALDDDGVHVRLNLTDGASVIQDAGAPPVRSQFRGLTVRTQIAYAGRPFRARGEDEREMTTPELFGALGREPAGAAGPAPSVVAAELMDRLVRPLSLLFMPLLAVPMSLATKRGSRATGLAAAAALLVTFNNALQFGKDLAAAGHAPAWLAVSAPFLVFAGLSLWLFVQSGPHPTEAPLARLFERFNRRAGGAVRRFGPVRRRRAA